MKRSLIKIGVATLMVFVVMTNNSQASDSKYRLGLQGTQFASGLSGIMEISNPWALHGILDFGADAVAFRVLNRFTQKEFWNAYGQGTVGLWTDNRRRPWGWQDDDTWNDNNNGFGFGVGMGLEYDWRGIEASLPPIGWNIEIGASVLPGFNLDLGIGVHWMF